MQSPWVAPTAGGWAPRVPTQEVIAEARQSARARQSVRTASTVSRLAPSLTFRELRSASRSDRHHLGGVLHGAERAKRTTLRVRDTGQAGDVHPLVASIAT